MCSSNADWLTSGARYGAKWEKCEKKIIKDKQHSMKSRSSEYFCFLNTWFHFSCLSNNFALALPVLKHKATKIVTSWSTRGCFHTWIGHHRVQTPLRIFELEKTLHSGLTLPSSIQESRWKNCAALGGTKCCHIAQVHLKDATVSILLLFFSSVNAKLE